MESKVSVIVPVYNRGRLISRCLDSIVGQTMKPYEIIIVDNDSDDDSVEVINQWKSALNKECDNSLPDIILLKEKERGAPAARQKGFLASRGDLILFFDSDDTMRPSLIEKAFTLISRMPTVDIVCWKCLFHFIDGKTRIPPYNVKDPLENHMIHALLRTQGYMIRREFLQKTGGWVKNLEVWNDFELGLRLLLEKPLIAGIDEILVDIYSQEKSITGLGFHPKIGLWEKTLDVMNDDVKKSDFPVKEKLFKLIQYRRAILAAQYKKEGFPKAGKELMKRILTGSDFRSKSFLNFVYYYTSIGGRGGWRIIKKLYL